MIWLFKAGGFPMIFVGLFGILAFGSSVMFWRRPDERRRALIDSFSKATLFSVGAGICSCLAAVFVNVPNNPQLAESPNLHLIVMQGLGESMAPGILGFTLLSLAAFVTALGARRATRP